MSSSSESDPERLLSSALKAQAGGAQTGGARPLDSRSDASVPGATAATGAATTSGPRKRLPVVRVLLSALALGLICGTLAALITLL